MGIDAELAEAGADRQELHSRSEQQRFGGNDAPVSDLEGQGIALSRTRTIELQHSHTVGVPLADRNDKLPLPPMGAGKPYPPDLLEKEGYIVEFDGASDPIHPQNWPMRTKVIMTAILSVTTFITTFASGIYAPAISTIAVDYNVAPEVATLGVTLYVLGFSAGPVLWGPLSEIKGRRLPLVVAAFGTAIFHFAVAVSKDLQSIMINRFWAGFVGAKYIRYTEVLGGLTSQQAL